LIEQHCQEFPIAFRIRPETWDRVTLSWHHKGENRALGASEYNIFRVLSERIFYGNYEIVLQGRSNKLLKCLVQTKGGFRSKRELVEAGWPGENHAGITEKALSEAIRRMKEDLKRELKTLNLNIETLDWVKSVRGRGYRLQQPNMSPETVEGENE
jgi:DNA-binding winged helix-turn-helix (wHTH) protein